MAQRRDRRAPRRVNRRIRQGLAELGIDAALPRTRRLVAFAEARRLVLAGLGTDGRDKFLMPEAAKAWLRMKRRARAARVELQLVSAFRSYDFQVALLRSKLARGMALEEILRVNAPPGYSEHHTGRAVDIGTPGCAALDEAFEDTAAFRWLARSARRFGFTMSYPRDNPQGYVYEPWHWRYR
jgi:D-alanyl-D-alanine carboxypeptidase